MPVTFAESEIKRAEGLWKALPEDLDLSPELNGRHDLPEIEWLIESMLMPHGQIQPVSIRKTGGRPLLTAGYSRYRAVAEINKRKLTPEPVYLWCKFTTLTDKQAFISTIHENHVRNASTPMDDAYNIQKLVNVFQMEEKEIADTYRASVQWVRERLTLLEVAPEVEKAIREKRINAPAAVALAKLDRAVQKAVVAKPGKVTAADVKAVTPKAAPKPAKATHVTVMMPPALRNALRVLIAECDQQPDAMVFEIHRDVVRDIRDSMGN